ncbi:VOC family protein [Dongia sp.]|uniref:VOC family protein n=1 Tax=Dongia sp. TaxID=1977262 RepID=UPI003752F28A
MPFDHIGFTVADFPKSKAFYLAVLAPLGMSVVEEGEGWALLGTDGKPEFWLGAGDAPGTIHFAFVAKTREAVRAFHAAALAAGGRDNGGPGIRGHYHPNYYGAFVFDPDGHNIEAVCHQPEG